MIVDAHVHIGRNQYEPVEMLLAQMELNGVSKTVLEPVYDLRNMLS